MKRKILREIIAVMLALVLFTASVSVAATIDASVASDMVDNTDVGVAHTDKSYSSYLSLYNNDLKTTEDIVYDLNGTVLGDTPIEFSVDVAQEGNYYIGINYKCTDSEISNYRIGLMIDGSYPFDNAEKLEFPRMWCDETGKECFDDAGNEFAPQQVLYTDYFYNEAMDDTVQNGDRYIVYLTKGIHTVSIIPVRGKMAIDYFAFAATAEPQEYSAPSDISKIYDGEPIIIEGEDATIKSSYFFVGKNNSASTDISPQSAEYSLINYIGGGNWSSVGDTIVWETPELEEGYYRLGFSFAQSAIIGGKSFRVLKIDGEVPFAEAQEVAFKYDADWQQGFFENDSAEPYLVYFSKGKHTVSLSVTSAKIGQVRKLLTEAVAELGDLYVDMTKITGETVDIYRDYELFKQIDDMEERLNSSRKKLVEAGDKYLEITGETSGSNYSVINNMVMAIDNMLNNKYEAHRYKDYFYTNYCSVSSVLQELSSMPLSIDKIILCSADAKDEAVFAKTGFFKNIGFVIRRFIVSFTKDYNMVSSSEDSPESVTIWVNWGRDQAQVLTSLVDRSFTPQTGINVNIELVNASAVQAILSGKGPDCFLMHSRSEPVNLAMRGVLYDLTKFDDCDEVLKRFQVGAEEPYYYKDGLYALPDTQVFFMMYYRKDILAEYNIEVPQTWEDYEIAAKLLMRNNMSVSLPATIAVDATTAGGVGTNNIYPSLLAQHKVPLYAEDGKSTNLLSTDAMMIFERWTNYYNKLKVPVNINFYNRFRVGTTPIGIASYTLHTQLEAAAPEIKGLWGIAPIPGTVQEDGTISHASAGGGTGCSILNTSEHPEYAWEFLKWWTSADTQLSYSNNIESILGPTGRVALANVEALEDLDWEDESLDAILTAWEQVDEVPEYPGSYYVARSIYQAFWNVVNKNKNPKDMIIEFGKEANQEISRKWEQYTDRG